MAKFSLRRYEDQAKISLIASLVSAAAFLALAALVIRAMRGDFGDLQPRYGTSVRLAAFGATAVSLFLSVIGFGLGINSVGQRRNERQTLSWIGFFVGAAVMVLTIGVFAFFYLRGDYVGR